MPKKGKTEAEWEFIMRKFAMGELKFSTGTTPGNMKWKKKIKEIEKCPRHHTIRDLFGKVVCCQCGYHKVDANPTLVAASESTQQTSQQHVQHQQTPLSERRQPFEEHGQHSVGLPGLDQTTTKIPQTQLAPHQQAAKLPEQTGNKEIIVETLANPESQKSQKEVEISKLTTLQTPQAHGTTFVMPQTISTTGQADWKIFLPRPFNTIIAETDRAWIAKILYNHNGRLLDFIPDKNWYQPPEPIKSHASCPDPSAYFRKRMFLWAPMRMWHFKLSCERCGGEMSHSGIYRKVRLVLDIDSWYYLVGGDSPRCNKCKTSVCPWNPHILKQLDPSHRFLFPAVLTKFGALDKKCVTLMKPRTVGNSSSYIQQALHEIHSEEWGKRCLQYLSDCQFHQKGLRLHTFTGQTHYEHPPTFTPLPLSQWMETVHSNEILGHVDEMKGVITSTYGRILKLDSTKKITKKLTGELKQTAAWMTNVANELGQVLNSVLTVGEGPALDEMCQGIVQRYEEANEPVPEIIYVDRDCCSLSGKPSPLNLFRPWTCHVRLDIYHFLRRMSRGLTTEHHPLYGTFCSKLSDCVFVLDEEDYSLLLQAKSSEMAKDFPGMFLDPQQVKKALTKAEIAKHCRRRTRGVLETKNLINKLLTDMWDLTDTAGLRLVSEKTMPNIWENQKKHIPCLQDPPGVQLYTKVGTLTKGGIQLHVLKCARGSSSLESFHKHQCSFVPSWSTNACHMQMYMLEGSSRWNQNRAMEAVDLENTSGAKLYNTRLQSAINSLSQKVLSVDLLPEFTPPGQMTEEKIAVDYLLSQSGKGSSEQLTFKDPDEGPTIIQGVEDNKESDFDDPTFSYPEDIDQFTEKNYEPSDAPGSDCERCGAHLPSDEMVIHMAKHLMEGQNTAVSNPEPDHGEMPTTPEKDKCCDSGGLEGWEAVDCLAAYLVDELDTKRTAITDNQARHIVELYSKLHIYDRSPTKYSKKSKREVLSGFWRTTRRPSGAEPGLQASERLYMSHGQAAQSPATNRLSECVCLRLSREYESSRNRPKDNFGRALSLVQAIVQKYSPLQQMLADSRTVHEQTNIVLVTINNTTVSNWLNQRQKRQNQEALLQGTNLPSVEVSSVPLPNPKTLPKEHPIHGHTTMTFEEPENMAGQSTKRPRRYQTQNLPIESQPSIWPPSTYPGWFSWPPFSHQWPQGMPPTAWPTAEESSAQPSMSPLPTCPLASRQRNWRQRKAMQEDRDRAARGDMPKKRHQKTGPYHYTCKKCQQQKCVATGHTQVKGKWYCPSSGMSVEEWKRNLQNK